MKSFSSVEDRLSHVYGSMPGPQSWSGFILCHGLSACALLSGLHASTLLTQFEELLLTYGCAKHMARAELPDGLRPVGIKCACARMCGARVCVCVYVLRVLCMCC